MSAVEVEIAPREELAHDDSLVHVTCCVDDTKTLCGAEVDGEFEPDDYSGGDSCVVCDDLDRLGCCPVAASLDMETKGKTT